MQIHLHKVKILQIHNARPEFVKKNITAINQSESSILILGVIIYRNIMLGRGICEKYQSRDKQIFPSQMSKEI